ncbi:hypothetical protein BRADI_5g14023v3, partial [Brachypodium distachyon]
VRRAIPHSIPSSPLRPRSRTPPLRPRCRLPSSPLPFLLRRRRPPGRPPCSFLFEDGAPLSCSTRCLFSLPSSSARCNQSRRRFLPAPVPAANDGRLRRGPRASARCACPHRSPPPRRRSSSSSCLRRPHPRPPLRGRRLRPPPITANGGTSSESTSTSQVASSASASAAPATRGARAFWGLAVGLVKRRFRHVLDIVGSSVDCNRSTTAGNLLPHLQKARYELSL